MFLVIDGSSMLVTNYYGNLPKQILFEKDPEKQKLHYDKIMHASDGTYTNAVYGMLRTILKIIKNQKPEYIAVVFDKTRNTFRREKYADYKGQRGATPKPLKMQFLLMEEILESIGIRTLYGDTYEADDYAGSIISKFEGPDMPMRFLTKDHDYLQLISEYTRGWMVQTKKEKVTELFEQYSVFGNMEKEANLPDKVFEFTADVVLSEEGVLPCQIPDLKGITGDTSDNIPGVKGVSAAAAPLLREYGTVEGIYQAIDDCTDEKAEKKLSLFWKEQLGISRSPLKALKENRDSAFLSKELATIVRDIPDIGELSDYRCNVNKEELGKVLKRLEFKSLEED